MEPPEIYRLEDAPDLPGLVFRPYRDEADLAGMAAVHAGSKELDQIDPLSSWDYSPSLADLEQEFAGLQPGDPNLLLIELDGRIIGYNRFHWWTEAGELKVYLHLGWLLPELRGKGIGRAALHWSQNRARQLAAEQGVTANAVLATNTSSAEPAADRLVLNEGYERVRSLSDMKFEDFDRLAGLDATLPDGVELRPLEPAHYRPIYEALKDARRGMFGQDDPGDRDFEKFLAHKVRVSHFTPDLWKIAWAGPEVVGLAVNYPHSNGSGVVDEVAVRTGWQRRGIAQALMVESLRELGRRGVSQVRLFTTSNDEKGALSLYKKLGFQELKQNYLYRKPLWD